MEIRGTFISMWEGGVLRTPATLNTETGEISTESVDIDDLGVLLDEQFESHDGDIYGVCPECHEYITKTVMKEGTGKTLYEAQVCMNPNCDNK